MKEISPLKKLYKHQQRFLDKNPDRALLVWETGTGKTLAACQWLKKRHKSHAVVVCPKALVGKWKRDLDESGVIATILTRDQVKGASLSSCRALVLDEAQDFSSPLFDKSRSQRATKIYTHIKSHPETNVLLLTATPIRSTPWNIHTLACYLQHVWPVPAFRNKFFYLTDIYGRMHYEVIKDWRTKIRPYVEEIADIVLMKDCIDVPAQHSEVVRIPWTEEQEKALSTEYMEPSAVWYARHRAEQEGPKLARIREIADGYRKIILVCNYTDQITHYSDALGKDRQVFVLNGQTKNPDQVITDARAADDCIFIIQASMGAGFDASEFSVVIFASMSFKYVDYVQMKGRVKRINNLHENLFIHLLAGDCDEAVYSKIMQGLDFDVHNV